MTDRGQNKVSIRMMGSCVVLLDGKVISGVPSIFYKIAAYLLLSASNGSASRQRLRSLLWSERDEADRAAANLRRSLARIRAMQAELGISLIESNFSTVYLVDSPDIGWDLRDFLVLIANKTEDVSLGRYPGDLLADLDDTGPDYEDWLSEQRNGLRARFIDRLAEGLTSPSWARKSASARGALAHEILAVDPCNEEAYRVLMMEAAANRNAARLEQIFQKCESELRSELGIPISLETRTLYVGLMRTLTG
jgi:DNA-binding SARP family transcriptional activator